MFADVNNFLGVRNDERLLTGLVVIEDQGAGGEFLVNHFISQALNNEQSVCLLALSQSFGHYNSIGVKTGLNLNASKESKNFLFIEGLKIIGNQLKSDPQCEESELSRTGVPSSTNLKSLPGSSSKEMIHKVDSIAANAIRDMLMSDNGDLRNLFLFLKSQIKELASNTKHQSGPVVIIDNINMLLDLGISSSEVVKFLHYVSTSMDSLTLVVRFENSDLLDDEGCWKLGSYLSHHCTRHICVCGLQSGQSREVHGQMVFTQKLGSLTHKPVICTTQFKIMDKDVKCFAPGLSTAVL